MNLIEKYHGKVLSSEEFKKSFPDRNDIFKINNYSKEKILFMPICIESITEYNKYKLILIGVLETGAKVAVIINDIKPYFCVKSNIKKTDNPENDKINFNKKIKKIIREKQWRNVNVSLIKGKGFKQYEHKKSYYAKLEFDTTWERKRALQYFIDNLNMETTTNDKNHYHRVACRDSLLLKSKEWTLSGWNELPPGTKFINRSNKIKLPSVYINQKDLVRNNQHIADKSIVGTWDIECYSSDHLNGTMPNPDEKKDRVFNISKTFHYKDSVEKLLSVTFSSLPCARSDDKLTVICTSEKDLILTSFFINSKIKPDYNVGFNDHSFDWYYVVRKATIGKYLCKVYDYLNLVDNHREIKNIKTRTANILKWNFRKCNIKISADTIAFSRSLQGSGFINIDARTMLRKIFPKERKSSLKFYLKINKLSGKEDMPIKRLFEIYEKARQHNILYKMYKNNTHTFDGNGMSEKEFLEKYEERKKDIAEVANYCVVDAFRCQELIQKLNVINDNREVSILSYTSLYDSIYYADGMKVRNLVIAKGQLRGIQFSTINNTPHGLGKYPGAHVFYPDKGLVKPKLTYKERIDKQDLKVSDSDLKILEQSVLNNKKPSIASSDTVISKLYEEFNNETTHYPISGLDFSSLYPSIIMTFNLSPEYMIFNKDDLKKYPDYSYHKIDFMCNETRVTAWSIRHDTIDGKTLQKGKTVNKMGLYTTILKNLFGKRTLMKKEMKKFAKEMEILKKESKKDDSVTFNYNYCNSKQKALKVFMNTFYGETGNKISPFFVLSIAGGITFEGRKNIKAVAEFVKEKGCRLYYGDTDSVYISCPKRNFLEYDKKYYSGAIKKKEYCTSLVKATFESIERIKVMVNNFLYNDNGTNFLRMAYEEVLYPSIFLIKKKYAGIEHQEIVNFYPKPEQLFIKGLSIRNRSSSKVLKTATTEVLMDIFDIYNTDTVMQVIKKKIENVYNRKWEMEDFRKTAVYKPNVQNISVTTFYQRMNDRNSPEAPLPIPGDRFEYVIVKKYPFTYDLKGRKSKLKVGDRMEYFTYAKLKKLPIDLEYYISKGIIGEFSQFIAYHKQFYVQVQDGDFKSAEESTVALANKFISGLCDMYSDKPKCRGPLMKKLYKKANMAYTSRVSSVITNPKKRKMLSYDIIQNNDDVYVSLNNIIQSVCNKIVKKSAKKIVDNIIKLYGKDQLKKFKEVLSTNYKNKNSLINFYNIKKWHIERDVRTTINNNKELLKDIYRKRDSTIKLFIDKLNSNQTIEETKIDMSFKDGLDMLYGMYNKLLNINRIVLEYKQILEEINFKIGITNVPPSINMNDEKKKFMSVMDF